MEEQLENIKSLFEESPDLQRMWYKLHTPLVRNSSKVRRNQVCPYCNSGKKFKNCECYKTHSVEYFNIK